MTRSDPERQEHLSKFLARVHGDPNGFLELSGKVSVYTLVFVLLAVVPALELRSFRSDTLSGMLQRHSLQAYTLFVGAVPLQFLAVVIGIVTFVSFKGKPEALLFLVPMVVGVCCDLVFVASLRLALHRGSERASVWRVVLLIALPLAGALFAIGAPLTVGSWTLGKGHGIGLALWSALFTDVFDILLCLSVVTCGVLFSFYHARWPAIQRPIYALARLKEPRKYVLLVGCALVLLGFASDLSAAKAVAKGVLAWSGVKL